MKKLSKKKSIKEVTEEEVLDNTEDINQPEDSEEVVENVVEEENVDSVDNNVDKVMASTQRLQSTVELVSEEFGLGKQFAVSDFKDKDKTVTISMSSRGYDISITVKDGYRDELMAGRSYDED